MFNRETKVGLAPKSWTAVAVWLVLLAVVISRPVESIGFFFGAVTGTGKWVSYHAFAECGEPPPMDWMQPKPCPPPTEPDGQPRGEPQPDTNDGDDPVLGDGTAQPDDRYVVTVDDQAIRTVLDTGVDVVVGLHEEVTEIQHAGGVTIDIGNQPTTKGGSDG